MKLMLEVSPKPSGEKITYNDTIFLIGSCFTEHIGKRLEELKFQMLQNPNGILFDPVSVCNSLNSYIQPKLYAQHDLFYLNELWQSWNHHSSFSGLHPHEVLQNINQSQQVAHASLKEAAWLVITLGSSFSYQLLKNNQAVVNCHRAPAQWFQKKLFSISETTMALQQTIENLLVFNPKLKIIFTISPVRHIRDGVVENNRSKARLIEAVHATTEQYAHTFYFPAYEIVIDCLRDYRFYDIDLVHPNYAATEIVFEKFEQTFMSEEAGVFKDDIKKVSNAFRHKSFQPETQLHKVFLKTMHGKVEYLQSKLPNLDFSKELQYFSTGVVN